MNKDTKTLLGLGAVAVILYELWKRNQPQQTGYSYEVNTSSPIPGWAQQLSADITQGSTSDAISDLLSIPQGPGGTEVNYGPGIPGFFGNPSCLLPPPGLTPSTQVFP